MRINFEKFTCSAEIVPPRNGIALDKIFDGLRSLKLDFVSVTKGAGGSLRGGTLPICHFVQSRLDIPAIAHFVCRDHTKYEIENELMDLFHMGIKNILALRGDPAAGSVDEWHGDYKYAYLLVEQIARMNEGIYLSPISQPDGPRKGFKSDFIIFVAGHPDEGEDYIESKVKAGAQFIITQMIFTAEQFKGYFKKLRQKGINVPVIAGIRPLRSLKQAESLESFFGIKVPEVLKQGLKKGGEQFGTSHAKQLIESVRRAGAAGVHLFCLNDFELVKSVLY